MSDVTLLPCPFCGGEAFVFRKREACCKDESCAGWTVNRCSIERWNRRATLAPATDGPGVWVWHDGEAWIATCGEDMSQGKTVGQALDRLATILLAQERPDSVKWNAPAWQPPPESERPEGLYLIFKAGRGFYRPNAQGYTTNIVDAGRYTRDEAISHTYPNGPDGPRDGLDYMPAPAQEDAPQTEYERKVAQAKEDFPNGF